MYFNQHIKNLMDQDILQIDLTAQSKKTIQHFFNALFKYIYELTDIKLVEYKSKLYFQTSNSWNGGMPEDLSQEQISRLAHKDHECVGYSNCEYESNKSKKSKKSKKPLKIIPDDSTDCIKYLYSWNESVLESIGEYCDGEGFDETVFDTIKLIDNFVNSDYEKLWSNVQIVMSKPLVINNLSGFNNDHRGSDHIPLSLPWEYHVHMDSTVTLGELTDTAYLIKSHKFDKWYELYVGVGSIDKSKHFIEVGVNFDHGS